jgi:hypothetical protein
MTFSRPQSSPVDAFVRPARPNEPQAAPRQVVTQTPNGGVRIVNLGGGESNAAAAARFFDTILQVAPPIIEEVSIERAKRQIGEITDNMDVSGLVRSGDQATIGMLRQLSPRAQDMVNTGLAKVFAGDYARNLATLATQDKAIQTPKGDEESEEAFAQRIAARRAVIRDQAYQQSGLANLSPRYRGAVALDLAQADSLVMNDVRKIQGENYNKLQDSKHVQIAKGSFETLTQQRLLFARDQGMIKGYTEQQRRELVQGIIDFPAEFINSVAPFATPTRAMELLTTGLRNAYTDLIGQERWEDAASLLHTAKMMTQQPLTSSTVKGLDLWSVPISDSGATFGTLIASLQAELKPRIEEAQAKATFQQEIAPVLSRMLQGDPTADGDFKAGLLQWVKNPDDLGRIISYGAQIRGLRDQPTVAQEREIARIRYLQSKEGADIGALNDKIAASTILTPNQQAQLFLKDQPEPDQVTAPIARAREFNGTRIQEAAMNVAQARIESGSVSATDAEDVGRETLINLTNRATTATEQRVRQGVAAGRTFTQDEVNQIFQNEIRFLEQSQLKALNKQPPQRPNPQQQIQQEINFVQRQLQQRQGRPGVEVFPPSVIDAARQNGIPVNDRRRLEKFFLERMGKVMGPDGKTPIIPDPGKLWRDMLRQSNPRSQNVRGNTDLSRGTSLQPVANLIQRFAPDALGGQGGATAQQSRPASQQSSGQRPQSSPVMDLAARVFNGVLSAAANVIAPPAMAAQQPLVFQQNMPAMNAAFRQSGGRGAVPNRLRQPPLPQLAAMTPVRPVPLAITNDKHPFFVAIGINEGTRTADGGYTRNYFGHTDPGDGNRNVGTVSGGGARGGGGTPQQVDKRWAGKLTQQAMRAAPVLVNAGIPRNTQAFNRLMFNYLDLMVQSPAAAGDFLKKLPRMRQEGFTIESIAKARTDSYYYPDGRWGAVWPYARMLADQRSRAGTFDYKRRL